MSLDSLARALRGAIPDPFVIALLLTAVAFGWALAVGFLSGGPGAIELIEAWVAGSTLPSGDRVGGLWSLLGFSMQMCLILVTGYAVAGTPVVQGLLKRVGALARGPRAAVVLVAAVAMGLGLIHWGLGLISGALLAREVGQRLAAQGSPVHYPALAAAGYSGLAVWHGGLSGSAPLKVTNQRDLVEVLGAELAARVGEIPLTQTVLSPRNLVVNLALLVVVPAVLVALVPRDSSRCSPPPPAPAPEPSGSSGQPPGLSGWLDRTPWAGLIIVVGALLWLIPWLIRGGATSLSPDHLNLIFFAAGLLLAGSPARYMALAREGAAACGGIIIQFPLYGGVLGLLAAGGVLGLLAGALPSSSAGLSLATLGAAGLINLFVPSGGGQWAVQGPVLLHAAVESGIEPGRVVLALAYGDQWTNLFQPFWALPLLGITGVKAGDLLGNTAIVGLAVGLLLALGVVLPDAMFALW